MTQVDFYILGDNSHRKINQMVCRLCEKALEQNMNVLIYSHSNTQAQQLDDLLWTFKENSFIPHKNQSLESKNESTFLYPVLICTQEAINSTSIKAQYKQLLINLTTEMPPYLQQFERIAELVGKNNEEKEIARNRYRTYRQNGYNLNKYDL